MIILRKPLITEKTLRLYKDENKVTFEVDKNAGKIEAKKVLEQVYNVKVETVTVTNRLGKTRLHPKTGRPVMKSEDKKIMVFKLKSGGKIDVFNQ